MERSPTSVFKKQWYRACISTHASCHAMDKSQLYVSITSCLLSLILTLLKLFKDYFNYNRTLTQLTIHDYNSPQTTRLFL